MRKIKFYIKFIDILCTYIDFKINILFSKYNHSYNKYVHFIKTLK